MTSIPHIDDPGDDDDDPWEPAELAAAHRDVLATVAELTDDKPPTGTDIGEACHVDTDHLYHILQVLDEEGLVVREQDAVDDRVLRNELTDEGQAILEQLQDRYSELEFSSPLDDRTLPHDRRDEREEPP